MRFIRHRKTLLIRGLTLTLAVVALGRTAVAAPFASGITNNAGTISFLLNESADDVKIIFDNGASTNDLGALAKGTQSFSLGVSTNYQIVVRKVAAPGFLTYTGTNSSIVLNGTNGAGTATTYTVVSAVSFPQQISTDSNPLVNFVSPRGIAINRNPGSPYFGRVYIANSAAGTSAPASGTTGVARNNGEGIYLLNADQTDALGLGDTASTAGLTFNPAGAASPYRLHVGQDDNLYIADWSTNSGNLYYADPNLTAGSFALKQLGGTATVPVGAANNHGSVSAVYTEGSLLAGNLKVWTIDEDLQVNKTATALTQVNGLWRYDINGGPLPYGTDPAFLWAASGKEGIAFATTQVMDLDRGTNGNFYINTYRSAGNESGTVVRNAAGTATLYYSWNATTNLIRGPTNDLFNSSYAIAVSPDQKYLADVRVDSRTWIIPLTNGIPDISRRLWLDSYPSVANARGVRFDPAGNLYVLSSGGQLVRVFSPGGTTVATTGNDSSGTTGTFTIARVDPDIFAQPQSLTNNAGTTAVLSVVSTGTGTNSYQWQLNGVNVAGATTSSLSRANAQQAVAGNYRVVVTNLSGAITSSIASLTIIDTAPIITVQPLNKSTNAGLNVTFTVATTGLDPRSYQWQFNGTNLAGATTTSLVKNNVQAANAGPYDVVITNALGAVTSSIVSLTVTDSIPIITAQPASKTNNAGTSITFTVTTIGTDPRSYQWQYNGTPITGATATTYTRTNLQIAADQGIYTVVITNGLGSATTTNAVLTVVDTLPLIATQPKGVTNGAGVNFTLSVVTTGTDPRAYQWSSNSVSILDATNSSYLVVNPQTNNTGDSYTVNISNSVGATNSAAAVLTITNRAPLILVQPVSLAANPGDSVALSVGAQGQNPLGFQWLKDGVVLSDGGTISGSTSSNLSLSNVQLVSDAGAYTVIITNSGGSITSQAGLLAVSMPSTPGTGTGLRGDYYSTQTQTFTNTPTWTRVDTNVDFNFGTGSPDPSVSVDHFTARWTGQVQPLYSQNYTFYTRSDDGSRLWVDGQLVVNKWVNQSVTETPSSPIPLTANQKYDVVMEYYENTSTAEAHLIWSSPSQFKQAISMLQLYPASTGSPITPVLSPVFSGTNIVFNWSGSYTLQTSVNVDGPYTNLTGLAVGPYTNSLVSDPKRFFRLQAN
jgi:hypothetical protein